MSAACRQDFTGAAPGTRACDGHGRLAREDHIPARRGRSPGTASAPPSSMLVGTPRDALGQEAAGPLGVARPERGLEQRVVEHVALGAAAAELDDARPQRLDPRHAPRVIGGREGVQPLQQRRHHLAGQARTVLGRALATMARCVSAPAQSPRRPAPSDGGVEGQALPAHALARDADERLAGGRPRGGRPAMRHSREIESCRSPAIDDGVRSKARREMAAARA